MNYVLNMTIYVLKNDEFCTKYDNFCIKTELRWDPFHPDFNE